MSENITRQNNLFVTRRDGFPLPELTDISNSSHQRASSAKWLWISIGVIALFVLGVTVWADVQGSNQIQQPIDIQNSMSDNSKEETISLTVAGAQADKKEDKTLSNNNQKIKKESDDNQSEVQKFFSLSLSEQYKRWQQLLMENNYQKIIEETTIVINKNSKNAAALRMRAQAYQAIGEKERGQVDVVELPELIKNPKTSEEYEILCFYLSNTTKFLNAEQACTKALKLNSKLVLAYLSRGYVSYHLGLNKFESKDNQNDEAHEHFEKALADFSKVVELAPKFSLAFIARADVNKNINYTKANQESALSDLTKSIKLYPTAFAYFHRGVIYSSKEMHQQALADFTKSINLNSKDPLAYALRAKEYLLMKEYDKAIADFTKAIELDAFESSFYEGRAEVFLAKREKAKAEADIKKAEELKTA